MPTERATLARAQVEALVAGDWLTTGPLRLNDRLTAAEAGGSFALENARRLVLALVQSGPFPLDRHGALKPQTLDYLLDWLKWRPPEFVSLMRQQKQPLTESDVPAIRITRVLLERVGLVTQVRDGLAAAPGAAAWLDPERAGELFARLFRAYFRDFDFSRTDPEDPAPEVHRYAAYSLWALARTGGEWLRARELLPTLLPRDLMAAATARLKQREARVTPQSVLMWRFLDLLPDYGIAECRDGAEGTLLDETCYRTLPLFDRFIRFDGG